MTTLTIPIGAFARSCLERLDGADLEVGVEAAIRHYATLVDSDRPPMAFPRARRARGACGGDEHLELALEEFAGVRLEREANRQDVSLGQLAAHAVMIYLVDRELGRA